MKFNRLWIVILCFTFLLSACGKENNEKISASTEPKNVNNDLEVNKEDPSDEFLKVTGVTLTGKEVQFDLANNLDKEFYLEGQVELCDYYNYGYTNEEKFFCGQLTPTDGGYSDSWYLYFHRDSFKNEYQDLLNGDVNMRVVAQIPAKSYKQGQGRMAAVKKSQSY
ncbi:MULTISPECIES: hypothetical protein [unclassified Lysinibacillus]|uniref:hypothetical protein n=1 Tax=unclassified Lysinibacillus TaxID=2636778 RepID=UPI00201266B4|nr:MULTISPECIES: hypothetical protein [unclassified Lysinibacillus]MCL1696256.1 hypothetical protein [Lysinibacillus sp. BPa_S21]MCL1700848.1 hypothetical protein [Lysinibacillus sp. Bpr_S20]